MFIFSALPANIFSGPGRGAGGIYQNMLFLSSLSYHFPVLHVQYSRNPGCRCSPGTAAPGGRSLFFSGPQFQEGAAQGSQGDAEEPPEQGKAVAEDDACEKKPVPQFDDEDGSVVKVSDIISEDVGTIDTDELIAQTAAIGNHPLGQTE